ncbi:MAG: glycoside hydrolase family 3 N-terminal domain-containing protein [Pseudomonadota bacterium]
MIVPVVALVLALGGGALAINSGLLPSPVSGSEDVTTASGGVPEEETAPGEMPLASASEEMVKTMTLEQKVGQMMVIGFEGTAPSEAVTAAITKRFVGGVILYDRNIVDQAQVAGMNQALQQLATDAGHPVKLMIGVDQEGGKTRRFEDIGPFYSQPMIGEMNDAAAPAAQQQAASAARDLKKLGFNTNFAPVADVSSGWGSIMDGRSFSSDPEFAAELTAAAVRGYKNSTTICSPKHFPGHGSAGDDSHEALPLVESDLATIESTDLPPFTAAIEAGAPMIMVAHLDIPALDATGTPSSLSRPVVTELLRGSMGFKGVVITDDLEMGAITETGSVGDAAVAAVLAGIDIVMVAQTDENQQLVYDALVKAVKSGQIKEEQIDKSVVRILDMKKRYRLEQ